MIDFFNICRSCDKDCCKEGEPTITKKRLSMLLKAGVSIDCFEFGEKVHPKLKDNGYCVFFDEVERKCKVHDVKPELCIAWPFTFDLEENMIKIYLKKENVCPIVPVLKQNRELYEAQLKVAIKAILEFISNLDEKELERIRKTKEENVEKVCEITYIPNLKI